MTKSTITRERAQQIFLGNGPEPSASEERELARMALTAMDSEPDCKERKLFCSTDTARMRKVISASAGSEATPLYRHAQQAPVPAKPVGFINPAREPVLYGEHIGIAIGSQLYAVPHPAPVVPKSISVREAISALESEDAVTTIGQAYKMGWNACRAAMLAAAPQSPGGDHATVQGKWIPVSERMPDDNSDVLCTAEFDGPGDWRRKVGYWHEGKWVVYGASWTPTHWMPLPAGPKGVKGE